MKKIVVVALALFIAACGNRMSPFEMAGAGLGALAGGALGYQIGGGMGQWLAMSIGAVAGGGAGYVGARMLTDSDLARYEKTAGLALDHAGDGEILNWSNPESGHRGIFRPTLTFYSWDGRYCRDYRTTVVLGPELKTGEGTACQQADGTWTPVTEQFG